MIYIQVIDDIKNMYTEFINSTQHPRLDNLNNWGKIVIF